MTKPSKKQFIKTVKFVLRRTIKIYENTLFHNHYDIIEFITNIIWEYSNHKRLTIIQSLTIQRFCISQINKDLNLPTSETIIIHKLTDLLHLIIRLTEEQLLACAPMYSELTNSSIRETLV